MCNHLYSVAGSNLFGQWLSQENYFERFNPLDDCERLKKSRLLCATWSYNLFALDDRIYISGAFRKKTNQFLEIPFPAEFVNISYKLVAGNDYNILIIDKYDSIYIFNLKTEHIKRLNITEYICDMSKKVKLKNDIKKVVLSNSSALYLTSEGNVYCGLLPIHLDTSACYGKVVDINIGYEHYLLLTDSGRVYTWGNGRRLQLGHGELNNLDTPTEVEALAGVNIVKISAGGWHSCALSEDGDLYVWGWNDTGQLGIKQNPNKESTQLKSHGLPVVIDVYNDDGKELEINVKDVDCGSRHTAILLEDGSVWTTGCNKYGQLGFGVDIPHLNYFKKSFDGINNKRIWCGIWNTVILS